jgi:spore coat polysaccharide biosynthesis protein SpsF (cytidylyltransferase family)
MTKTVAFIQARMSSTRFPGKVLADLDGKPMIQFMIDRVKRAKRIDQVVLVTSTDASDDPVAELMACIGTPCFRGSLDDVLGRFHGASLAYPADVYVRLTGDCPLIDPAIIDDVLGLLDGGGCDYASNIDPPSFADGLDVECFTHALLDRAHQSASLPQDREHVTLWMRQDTNGVATKNYRAIADSSSLRLTVDYADDLDVVRQIVQSIGADCDVFDVLRALQRDMSVVGLNQHERNEALKN